MHVRLHRPHLTHTQAKRLLWVIFGGLVCLEAGLALHLIAVHEAIAGSLGLTALSRDSLMIVVESVGSAE